MNCTWRKILDPQRLALAAAKYRIPESISRPDRLWTEFLEMLRCPRCAGAFASSQGHHDPGFDIWRCACSKWPVVAGIPILSQPYILPTGQRSERIVALIEGRQYMEALLSLVLLPPSVPILAAEWAQRLPAVIGIRRLQRLLHEHRLESWTKDAVDLVLNDKGSACELFNLRFRESAERMPAAYDYFACRFGQPRHLVALSLITLLDHGEGPVLDLGCGAGHMIFSLLQRGKTRPVIGIERDFTMLHIAKQRIAPEGHYICMDADQRLPFRDGFLSGLLCSDAFHYFAQKTTAVNEVIRTVRREGLIALAVLRNSNFEYQQGGIPLAPEDYSRLFESVPHRIVPDQDLLTSYLKKRGPQLEIGASAESLRQSPTLSLVASSEAELLHNHEEFSNWPHAAGVLVTNPLYRVNLDSRGTVLLRQHSPSQWYELDHPELKQYLPEHLELSYETLSSLARGDYSTEGEKLIQHCAIVGIPEHYGAGITLEEILQSSAAQWMPNAGGEGKSANAA